MNLKERKSAAATKISYLIRKWIAMEFIYGKNDIKTSNVKRLINIILNVQNVNTVRIPTYGQVENRTVTHAKPWNIKTKWNLSSRSRSNQRKEGEKRAKAHNFSVKLWIRICLWKWISILLTLEPKPNSVQQKCSMLWMAKKVKSKKIRYTISKKSVHLI